MIAAPAAAGEVVGIGACGMSPALQFYVKRLVCKTFPSVSSGRHGISDMRVVASVKSIPEYFVLSSGKRLVVKRPRYCLASGVLYDNRDIRRLVKLELDRLEARLHLDCLERAPVNSGKSVLHHDRKRPSIGEAKRLRRTALFDKLCKPPYVGAHECHHAVRLNAFTEKLLCREPLVTVRAVVRLEC